MKTIRKSEIIAMMNAGMKTKEIANELGISIAKFVQIKKGSGLTKKRPSATPFEFIDDVTPAATAQPIAEVAAE